MKCKLCENEMEEIEGQYKCMKCKHTQNEPAKHYVYPLSGPDGKFKKGQ